MPDTLTLHTVRTLLPERPDDAHKGSFGHVLLVAGSQRYLGASKLAAAAAARSGVGLVTVGVPGGLAPAIAAASQETMTYAMGDTSLIEYEPSCAEPALAFADTVTGVGLGPGLSHTENTEAFVHAFVPNCPQPLIIDADGLNGLSANVDTLKQRENPTVLTPHPGEMARLNGTSTKDVQADRIATATTFAQEHGCVVVLKGAGTVVAAPSGEVCVNPTGNAGLATGGTGDVLTGLLAGLLAQRIAAYDAARIAVYVHGLAGDLAAHELTQRGMTAPDVTAHLPHAWRSIEDREAVS